MIAFCGYGRSGKDTSAYMFSKITGIPYAGSISWMHKEIVAAKLGIPDQLAWDTRHEIREDWKRILEEYRGDDPAKLIRTCLKFSPIVCGARTFLELQAALQEGLIKIAVWVDRPGIAKDPTVTYTSSNCTHVLNNAGDLRELNNQIAAFISVNFSNGSNGLMVPSGL
jgi:hypothetical protein